MRWAWKEERRRPVLAVGDGYLQGLVNIQTWGPGTVVATDDGVFLLRGIDIRRDGRFRARGVLFRTEWTNIVGYLRDDFSVPEQVGWESTDAVALDLKEPSGHTVVIRGSGGTWASLCRAHGIGEIDDEA